MSGRSVGLSRESTLPALSAIKGSLMIFRKTVLSGFVILLSLSCAREQNENPVVEPSRPASSSIPPAPPLEGVSVGSRMPPYQSRMLDGSPFDVANLRGDVVLLNVWATWCGPCRAEIPVLKALHDKHRARKFSVVGISVDEKDFEGDVKKYVEAERVQFPIVLDPDGRIGNIFQISVLPTSLLLDREGKIVWFHTGLIEEGNPSLAQALAKVL